jgi:hypothetical protein
MTMNEREWLACTSPECMLQAICGTQWLRGFSSLFLPRREKIRRKKIRQRKLRLCLCACFRLHWECVRVQVGRAVEVAEQYADGLATKKQLRAARRAAEAEVVGEMGKEGWWTRHNNAMVRSDWDTDPFITAAAMAAAETITYEDVLRGLFNGMSGQLNQATRLLRDLFGNPFRPVTLDPTWLTWGDRTVVRLVQAAHQERELPSGHLDRARLAVLADALEEAGVTDPDLLDHLRGPGPHVHGCYVLDLILGRQ